MPVKVAVRYYVNGEQMQRDMVLRKERGYQVVGQPFLGPPPRRDIVYLVAVGLDSFIKRKPVWMVTYARI